MRTAGIAFVAAIALTQSAPCVAAPRNVPSASGTCFQGGVEPSVGPIRRMTVDVQRRRFLVEQWGVPRVRYVVAASCDPAGHGKLSCSVDCEAWSDATLAFEGGRLRVTARRFALYAELLSALPPPGGVDAAYVSGTFDLAQAPQETCAAAFADGNEPPEVERGDFGPSVEQAETVLVDLGYLSHRPGWLFTDQTAGAVRSFQQAAGLPTSARGDRRTMERLRTIAAVRGGGC